MAKQGQFGKIIPKPKDIVKIDGVNVVDADGDVFSRDLVMDKAFNTGDWEIISFADEKPKKKGD